MSEYLGETCTMKTKEHSKQLSEKMVEKQKSGGDVAKSVINKWKESGTAVSLHGAGRPVLFSLTFSNQINLF